MQLMTNDYRAESFVDTNDTERRCDPQIIEKTPTHTKSKLLTRDAISKKVKKFSLKCQKSYPLKPVLERQLQLKAF